MAQLPQRLWYLLPPGGLLLDSPPRRSRPDVLRYLAPPSPESPGLLLPLELPQASTYGLRHFTGPCDGLRRLRREVVDLVIRAKAFPTIGPVVAVAAAPDGQLEPELVVVARRELGIDPDGGFFVRPAAGDALARGQFFLFRRGAGEPAWVLKFASVQGFSEQFDGDERGLRLAEACGATAAGHAPRLVGRFVLDGRHASVETALPGAHFGPRLVARGLDRLNRGALDQLVAWLGERDIRTARPAADGERDELRAAHGELAACLERVPVTIAHDDLGCWNVLVDRNGFGIVDWERATGAGVPLWDAWYLLVDAASLADQVPRGERERSVVELFAGRHELSPLLFDVTRRVVSALSLDPGVVGQLATLLWHQHAHSYAARDAALVATGFSADDRFRFPEPVEWYRDPSLGPGWSAWRAP